MYTTSAELALFAHTVQKTEANIDLEQAIWLLGTIEDATLDLSQCMKELKSLSDRAKSFCENAEIPAVKLAQFLFHHEKFSGDTDNYYNPQNSFLHQVLVRRTGIPISLSVLMILVGKHIEIPVEGVGFPGHFLVRVPIKEGYLFFDPFFHGRILSREHLQKLFFEATGQETDPPPIFLQQSSKTQILWRMLQNLRAIYQQNKQTKFLQTVLQYAALLRPEDSSVSAELSTLRQASKKPIILN